MVEIEKLLFLRLGKYFIAKKIPSTFCSGKNFIEGGRK